MHWMDTACFQMKAKMVRTYRPTKRGPQKMWEPDSMRRAVAAIKSGEVKSLRLASKLFEVPKTTLARRLKKLANVDAPSAHKATALTTDEEDQLSQWLTKGVVSSCDKLPFCEVCDDQKEVAPLRCLDCKQNICTNCHKIHQRISATSHHLVTDIQQTEPTNQQHRSKCPSHNDQDIQLYCTTCAKLICRKCSETDHRHPEHEYIDCAKASASLKQSLVKFFGPLETIAQYLSMSSSIACKIEDKLDSAVERTIKDVKSKANEVKKELIAHENRLIDKIVGIQIDRSVKLDEHKWSVTNLSQQVQQSVRSAREASHTLTDEAFVNLYPSISEALETLTTQDLPQIDAKLSCMRFDSGQSDINLGRLELKGRHSPGEFSAKRSVSSVSDEVLSPDYDNEGVVVCYM
ncbi:E3 ubiquitin-protein ligase TRIM33-like isoform X1 [Asterias rubens]|uniref:E3 ubiquitin-protein ligase TRIM33-like isoform X1 n=2 Tax=Asterias rubens TaxID=7604 RepID=UPI001455661F|nr:E3 ubiquitin-protein ligase TRIM33-like isoform X1 [Asterias rubens]